MAERRAYEEMARVGKALAAPTRLELLELLVQRPCSVEELARMSGASVANTSQHLKVLREAKLVSSQREGRRIVCSLAPGVEKLVLKLRRLAVERLPELGALRSELAERDEINAETLIALHRRGEVDVIDVRPADEFAAGHLEGARSIPLDELPDRLGELSGRRDIVAYCRGPWCVYAREAVALLRSRGLTAHRLELGVSDFRELGLYEGAA